MIPSLLDPRSPIYHTTNHPSIHDRNYRRNCCAALRFLFFHNLVALRELLIPYIEPNIFPFFSLYITEDRNMRPSPAHRLAPWRTASVGSTAPPPSAPPPTATTTVPPSSTVTSMATVPGIHQVVYFIYYTPCSNFTGRGEKMMPYRSPIGS